MRKGIRVAAMMTLCALAAAVGAAAGPAVETGDALRERIYSRFIAADYAEAARLIELHLRGQPRDADMLYNGACAYSRLGLRDRAADFLFRAVEAGFREFDRMREDADLAPIRDHETYLAIVEAGARLGDRQGRRPVPSALEAGQAGDSPLARWRGQFGEEHYSYERDAARRLAFATALDEESKSQMRQMIERQCDQLAATLFEAPPNEEILIAIPTPADASKLLKYVAVGGTYDHAQRVLVSRNIGGNLRHELVHVLHHAHMDRLSQTHPLWVQEGLATLYEEYEWSDDSPDASIKFKSNERHNVVRRQATARKLTPWSTLITLSDDQFMAQAEVLYPQARSIFQFIASRGKLGEWYRALVKHFGEDPTGRKAMEAAFGADLNDVERQWKVWLTAQPALDLRIESSDAALGVKIALDGANDGVVIENVLSGSAAGAADLRAGDVIVAVDGRATRSANELLSIVGARRVGDRVEVRFRRGADYQAVTMTLRPVRVR